MYYLVLFVVAMISAGIQPSRAAPMKLHGLYVNTFGDKSHQPLVFVHGGPGFHSYDFELTTAPALAREGYYVVVYDQRGQGRSEAAESSQFNYKQYAADLKSILDALSLKAPVLLGHSHGGPIAIKFNEAFPGVAKKTVLVSAPIHFWGSMHSLFENCSRRYTERSETAELNQLSYYYFQLFANPDLPRDQYASFVSAAFIFGVRCGLYQTQSPSPEELRLRSLLEHSPISGLVPGSANAVEAFLANENYVRFNGIDHVVMNRTNYCGIYGAEDGLQCEAN